MTAHHALLWPTDWKELLPFYQVAVHHQHLHAPCTGERLYDMTAQCMVSRLASQGHHSCCTKYGTWWVPQWPWHEEMCPWSLCQRRSVPLPGLFCPWPLRRSVFLFALNVLMTSLRHMAFELHSKRGGMADIANLQLTVGIDLCLLLDRTSMRCASHIA